MRAGRTVQVVLLRTEAPALQQHHQQSQQRQGATSAHGNRLKTSWAPPDFLNAKFDASLARLIAACEVQALARRAHVSIVNFCVGASISLSMLLIVKLVVDTLVKKHENMYGWGNILIGNYF